MMIEGAIEGWIASGSGEADIEQALDTLCSLVPGFTATVCSYISIYIDLHPFLFLFLFLSSYLLHSCSLSLYIYLYLSIYYC